MQVHVRSNLVVSLADQNGDVVAIRRDHIIPGRPAPHWVLHLLGGGTDGMGVHVVDSERVYDGEAPVSPWARIALLRIDTPILF